MRTRLVLCILFWAHLCLSQECPGGVCNPEVWFMVNHVQNSAGQYPNKGMAYIPLALCSEHVSTQTLFNFNDAMKATKLCMSYAAPLENTIGRNVFFVGEDVLETRNGASHVTTQWNAAYANVPADSIVHNRFDFAYKNSYANKMLATYTSVATANVNFYHYNQYDTDRKFKSYGYGGETRFFIGKEFVNPLSQGSYFNGSFPEYVSYAFELSKNERMRVESYLALKYGITLTSHEEYLSSRNVAFWKHANYSFFGNRVFGIGRDDVSGLKQYQSESVHLKNMLIASVQDIALTNTIKQGQVSIPNNHFIVFGDNGAGLQLTEPNPYNTRLLKRIWLSQNTGGLTSSAIPMDFKASISGALAGALAENPDYVIWMLHDKNVTSQQASDFSNPYVEYYKPFNVQAPDYAFYEDINFDSDQNLYDQFTFGIGPKIIVQARYEIGDCSEDTVNVKIKITGGVGPYTITINHGFPRITETFTVSSGNTLDFTAANGMTYYVSVLDSQGNEAFTDFMPELFQMNLDLGPDQTLTSTLQQVTFDASTGIGDPGATYQWYFNGQLLEGETNPVYTATEPGEYKVVVIDSYRRCTVTDTVVLSYDFTGSFETWLSCEPTGNVDIALSGGIAPYMVSVTGNMTPTNQVQSTDSFTVSGIPQGQHSVAVTDANGHSVTHNVYIANPLSGLDLNVIQQVEQYCTAITNYYFFPYTYYQQTSSNPVFDASTLVTYPNVTYQWFVNGLPFSQSAQVTIGHTSGIPLTAYANEVTIQVINNDTGCYNSQTFYLYKEGIREIQPIGNEVTGGDRQAVPEDDINAWVYPNPTEPGKTFNYRITATQAFTGTVSVYSPTGALIHAKQVSGQDTYVLPFQLTAAGLYLIRTETANKTLTNKILIR